MAQSEEDIPGFLEIRGRLHPITRIILKPGQKLHLEAEIKGDFAIDHGEQFIIRDSWGSVWRRRRYSQPSVFVAGPDSLTIFHYELTITVWNKDADAD